MDAIETERSVFDLQDLRDLLSKGERIDGRRIEQYRHVLVNRDSIGNGTVLVKTGETSVICGLKVVQSDEQTNDLCEFHVEFDNLSPKKADLRTDLQDAQRVTQLLKAIFNQSPLFDGKLLQSFRGNFRWTISVEIIALNNDGNLFDSALVAFLCALCDIRIPVIDYNENTRKIKYLDSYRRLELLSIPVSTTFALFGENHLLIDPNADEELASSGFMTIIFDSLSNKILSVEKRGGFGIDIDTVNKCIAIAKQRSLEIQKLILNETQEK